MKRIKYRRFLIVIFVCYLCAFLYYLCHMDTFEVENRGSILTAASAETVSGEGKIKKYMPVGMPVGIYIRTKGVMVLGVSEVTDDSGKKVEPAKNILKSGDYILEVNGEEIPSIDWFKEKVETCGGKALTLTILHEDKEKTEEIMPVLTESSEYRIGVWIRQDAQGIGTLSFVDENNHFAALGHGITDIDTSAIINIRSGRLYESRIVSIIKGEKGTPGEMVGNIDYKNGQILGKIDSNNDRGIFGVLEEDMNLYDESQALPAASQEEVREGNALVRCCIDGEIHDYTIEIMDLDLTDDKDNRNMVIKITDPNLLNRTNGIIQGMSGSPIIQDGKLVGAVTHVLVNDPTRGYGIFIENMLGY